MLQVFELTLENSYYLAIAPPLLYTALCMYVSKDNQVTIAYLLSLYYGCIMALYFVWNLFTMIDYNTILTPLGMMMICKYH